MTRFDDQRSSSQTMVLDPGGSNPPPTRAHRRTRHREESAAAAALDLFGFQSRQPVIALEVRAPLPVSDAGRMPEHRPVARTAIFPFSTPQTAEKSSNTGQKMPSRQLGSKEGGAGGDGLRRPCCE
jgi:hypothetical protein